MDSDSRWGRYQQVLTFNYWGVSCDQRCHANKQNNMVDRSARTMINFIETHSFIYFIIVSQFDLPKENSTEHSCEQNLRAK